MTEPATKLIRWGILGEQEHLFVKRTFRSPLNAGAVATACGKIGTPSGRDHGLEYTGAPVCVACRMLQPPDSTLTPISARKAKPTKR